MAITFDQAVTEREFHKEGGCHRSIGPRGGEKVTMEVWRRNGATKTWKTRPGEFRLPIKFGLRSYDAVTERDSHLLHLPSECPLNDPEWEG